MDIEPRPGETPEEAAYRGAIDAATAILVAYDGGTAKHSDDVLTVSEAIADRLKVTGDEKKHLKAVAQLHDIGKIMVSSEILNKPGPLDDEEWETMRRHTIEGEDILGTVPEISEVAEMVRACHERYDGDGYPDGLAGEDIPLVARIVFCADAFHAMRCDRPYRAGRPVEEALVEMKANAGTQFDPVVVAALCDVHATIAIQRKYGLGVLRSGARSRRLIALLATLTVSGSAMAATGAYKALPLVHDGDSGNVPTVIHNALAATKSPVFGAAHPSAPAGRDNPGGPADAGRRAGLPNSSTDAKPGQSEQMAGGAPEGRGASEAAPSTAPGSAPGAPAAKPAPRRRLLPHRTRRPKKDPKAKERPRNEPKLTLPKAKVEVTVPKLKAPKLKAPNLKAEKLKAPKVKD